MKNIVPFGVYADISEIQIRLKEGNPSYELGSTLEICIGQRLCICHLFTPKEAERVEASLNLPQSAGAEFGASGGVDSNSLKDIGKKNLSVPNLPFRNQGFLSPEPVESNGIRPRTSADGGSRRTAKDAMGAEEAHSTQENASSPRGDECLMKSAIFEQEKQPHVFSSRKLLIRCNLEQRKKRLGGMLPTPGRQVQCGDTWTFLQLFELGSSKKNLPEAPQWTDDVRLTAFSEAANEEERGIVVLVRFKYILRQFGKEVLPAKADSPTLGSGAPDWEKAWTDLRRVIPQGNNAQDVLKLASAAVENVAATLQNVHPIAALVVYAFRIINTYLDKKKEHADRFRSLIQKASDIFSKLSSIVLSQMVKRGEDEDGKAVVVCAMEAILEAADCMPPRKQKNILQTTWLMIRDKSNSEIDEILARLIECEELLEGAEKSLDERKECLHFLQRYLKQQPQSGRGALPATSTSRTSGTMHNVLGKLHKLIDESSANAKVVWVNGSPGCGKTVVMESLRRERINKGDCTIAFFFGQQDINSDFNSDTTLLWPTVAYHLAQVSIKVRSAIKMRLSGRPNDECAPSPREQLDQLIADPVHQWDNRPKITIIVDGVDRAALVRDPVRFSQLLASFQRWPSSMPSNCTLVVASRDLCRFRETFPDSRGYITYRLPRASSSDDIKQHLKYLLGAATPRIGPRNMSREQWPDDRSLNDLVKYAEGSFLWATTAIRFICAGNTTDREVRLQKLRHAKGIIPVSPDWPLYSSCIQILCHVRKTLDGEETALIRNLFGALVTFQGQPSFSDLQALCILPTTVALTGKPYLLDDLSKGLGHLLPFIHWASDGSGMSFFHPAIKLLLLSEHSRPFRIDKAAQHGALAHALIRWMNSDLHFNIGAITSSHTPPPSTTTLHSLYQYAAKNLALHLTAARGCAKGDIAAELECLFDRHYLHWLEVMSLLKKPLAKICDTIDKFRQWTETHAPSSLLRNFLPAAQDFCRQFSVPISFNPAHIYISALPFAPSSSLVRTKYGSAMKNCLEPCMDPVAVSRDHKLASGEVIIAVGFAPDCRRVISVSNLYVLYELDRYSSKTTRRPLLADNSAIALIAAISSSGKYVAFAQANCLRYCDITDLNTGRPPIMKVTTIYPDCSFRCLTFFPVIENMPERLAFVYSDEHKDGSPISTLRVIEVDSGVRRSYPSVTTKAQVRDLTVSPDGAWIMAQTSQTAVTFCAGDTPRVFFSTDTKDPLPLWDVAKGVCCSPNPFKITKDHSLASSGRARDQEPFNHHVSTFKKNLAYITHKVSGENTPRVVHLRHSIPADSIATVSRPVSGRRNLLAAVSRSKHIYVWDCDTGVLLFMLPSHAITRGNYKAYVALCRAPRDHQLVIAWSKGDTVIWDVSDRPMLSLASDKVYPVIFRSGSSSRHLGSERKAVGSTSSQTYVRLDKAFQVVLDDHAYADRARWVRDKDGNALFWLPSKDRTFWWPRMIAVSDGLADKMLSVNVDKFVHGTNWTKAWDETQLGRYSGPVALVSTREGMLKYVG